VPDIEADSFGIARRRVIDDFVRLTPVSRAHFERTNAYQPHGVDRTGGISPYPMYIDRARGPNLYDLDGRRIVDMLNQSMGGVLGHANPAIQAAARRQLGKGMLFTMCSELENRVAQQLTERIPSVDAVRFQVTGGESTMMALRLARAYTGRGLIAKTEGSYHGHFDAVWLGLDKVHHIQSAGEVAPGLTPDVDRYTINLPFNDVAGAERMLESHKDELAAVILEPVLGGGGSIAANPDWLSLIRDVTRRYGIVLIFDEMITLAFARGGAQELYGVIPDMTCGGKNVGGGFPMSFYGGRRELMDLTAYGPGGEPPRVLSGGTYHGHPVAMATSLASFELLDKDAYAHLHAMGDLLRDEVRKVARRRSVPLQVTGAGHMFGLFWSPDPIVDYRSTLKSDVAVDSLLQTALLNKGYFTNGWGIVTTAHRTRHIQGFARAVDEVLVECDLAGS